MKGYERSKAMLVGTLFSAISTSTITTVSGFSTCSRQTALIQIQQHPTFAVRRSTALSMGLFDGVKDAFSAPALERSSIDKERETPIDRWMGWNVKKMEEQTGPIPDANFLDSMNEVNYITTKLTKPMGIVFEENDEEYGGIFVLSLNEGGIAEKDATIKPGDQLVAVNEKKVSGFEFDAALGTIVEADTEETKLLFFRGTSAQLYGPTGASKDWLEEFVAKGGPTAIPQE